MNALELRNVSRRYGDFRLKDISFDLEEGSILGVIGENGAGKSTLLEIILGMVSKNDGTVRVLDCDDLSKHHEIRSKIGFVMDKAGFPDTLSAKDISDILGDIYTGWNEELFFDLLKQLDTETGKQLKHLSQGSRMKVMIAAAFAHEPRLLILDEATNFLDPAARAVINNYLYEYTRDEKNTVVLSSHLAGDLEKIADQILFLHKGEILMYRPKDEILDMYAHVSASAEVIDSLNPDDVKAVRKSSYGAEAVILRKALTLSMDERPASLEEIFTALVKGVI